MESLSDVFKIIQPNCQMASVDLKDAFYTIPIHNAYQKYFKFMWYQKFYKYLGMTNGYSDAMRVFTKMLKPPVATFRKQGFISVIFVDNSYLQGSTRGECLENVHKTVNLLASLGFTIHKEKSVLEPTQCIEFLGFITHSADMTVKINPKKSEIIIEKIKNFLDHKKPTTRQLASVIGSCIFLFPALPLGKMHYRNLEKEKTKALKLHQGNFNSKLGSLNSLAVQELHWWLQHIPNACMHIHLPKIDFTIYTDASELGWGATDGCFPIGGRRGANEQSHINFLELKAVFLALNRYYESWNGSRHIRIKSDNTTAIAYLNNMGGGQCL